MPVTDMWFLGSALYRKVSNEHKLAEAVVGYETDSGTVDVEGVVEYKSLPSGLHNVTEDLVYVQAVQGPRQSN